MTDRFQQLQEARQIVKTTMNYLENPGSHDSDRMRAHARYHLGRAYTKLRHLSNWMESQHAVFEDNFGEGQGEVQITIRPGVHGKTGEGILRIERV